MPSLFDNDKEHSQRHIRNASGGPSQIILQCCYMTDTTIKIITFMEEARASFHALEMLSSSVLRERAEATRRMGDHGSVCNYITEGHFYFFLDCQNFLLCFHLNSFHSLGRDT